MSRRAHPPEAVKLAHALREQGLSYLRIAREIASRIDLQVGESTVRDWVTYYSRRPG